MRAPSRLPVRLAAVLSCAAIVAGCTSSSGADDPTIHLPSSTAGAPSGSATSAGTGSAAATTSGRSPASRRKGVFTMAFAGDVHFAGRIGDRLVKDPATVFGQAAPGLRKADLTMVNLETAITTGGGQQNKEFTFSAPPKALIALRDAGIDVATMANNHGADYGATGLQDSLAASVAEHFPIVGIGANADQAFSPYTTRLNGVQVAIFAADQVHDETTLPLFSAGSNKPGVANGYDPALVDRVRAAKRAGYVVVVYLHWGIEFQTCPSPDQTRLAGRLAAAGATAVVGSHAHVLEGAGWLPDGAYVAYGLGNYLWWRSFGNNQDDNGVLTLTFDHGVVRKSHFAPAHLDDRGVPVPAIGAEKKRIAAEFAADRSCTDLSATPSN